MSTMEESDIEGSSDASDIDVDRICAGIKCIYSIESSDSDEPMCDRNTATICKQASRFQNVATGSNVSNCTHMDDSSDARKTTVDIRDVATGSNVSNCTHMDDSSDARKTTVYIRGGFYVHPSNFKPQKSCPGIWEEVVETFSRGESLIYFGISLIPTVGASLKNTRSDNIICDLIVFTPSRIPLVLTVVREEMTKQDKAYNNILTRTITSIVREHSTPNFVASHGVLEERQSKLLERRVAEFDANATMFAIPDTLYMDKKKYQAVIGSFLNSVDTFRFTEEGHPNQDGEVQMRPHSAAAHSNAQPSKRRGMVGAATLEKKHDEGAKFGKSVYQESRWKAESGYLTPDEGYYGDT